MSQEEGNERDGLSVALDEGHAFLGRLPDVSARTPFAGLVALGWGMLRAIYECPYCPGRYRVPVQGATLETGPIVCPNCLRTWTKRGSK